MFRDRFGQIAYLFVIGAFFASSYTLGGAPSPGEEDTVRTAGRVPSDSVQEEIQSPETYESFLQYLDGPDDADTVFSRSVVQRHLEALTVVLPDDMSKQLGLENGVEDGTPKGLADTAGLVLTRWWRRLDPYPATNQNERLQEHLNRTVEAFQKYSREDDDHRLDDRGRVYVRYGAPDRKREIEVGKEGEFWVYSSHSAAEFVFIRDRGHGHEIGSPTDLLPDDLRHGFGPTDRGTRKSMRTLSTLEHIYRRLSHFRSRYGIILSDLSMYNEQVRQARDGLPTPTRTPPHSFVVQKMEEIQTLEAEATRHRDEMLPQTESNVGDRLENLPIAARWIRTLQPDGSTEVSLYWGFVGAALAPSEWMVDSLRKNGVESGDGYLLTSSLVQMSESYEKQKKHVDHLFVPKQQGKRGRVKTQEERFELGHTAHAALQVDEAWASVNREEEAVSRKALLKVGTARVDSITPLQSEPSFLEMSDLTPIRLSDTTSVSQAPVYPFHKISPDTPLGLRFEIYHLTPNGEGRTQYTVEYVVRRTTDPSGLEKLFQDEDERRTSVKSTVTGTEGRTVEYVLLDPEGWVIDETQEVSVTVKVTDERSGQETTRSIAFSLVSESD